MRALVAVTAFVAHLAFAAPAAAIDLLQAFDAARENDAQVSAARYQLAAVRERVDQALALQRPAANASAATSRQRTEIHNGPTRSFTPLTYGVSLSYPLYRPANEVALEQSQLQVRVAELQYLQAEQDLAVRVAQAYFGVLSALDTLAAVQAQNRAAAEQYEAAKRNFEVGTATITDQQEAQARLDLGRAQEVAARNELLVRRAALELLIGRPPAELARLKPGVTLTPPQPLEESEWTQSARQLAYTVRQAELATQVARQEILRARYAGYPSLDLVGSVQRADSATVSSLGIRSTSGVLGVQLSVPIYAGGGIDARVREAVSLQNRSEYELINARRAAEQAARQAYLGVLSGVEQARALEAAVRSSQLALESNLLGYQVGVRINIDVLNAQQQLFTAQRDLARARYDVLVNSLVLQATVADLNAPDLAAINALLEPPK